MAQIGYGYGSEWQLLRFLGHHRDRLNEEISSQTGVKGTYHWLDFGFADRCKVMSEDSEIKGISFIKSLDTIDEQTYKDIETEYKSFNIGKIDSWQNWDAVLVVDKAIYLVEAKAHTGELCGNEINGGNSANNILNYMQLQLQDLPVNDFWLKNYYQLANRLATTSLLNKHLNKKGISVRTMVIYFVNGYQKRVLEGSKLRNEINKDASKDDFEKAIDKELESLGLKNVSLDSLLTKPVYIDCLGKMLFGSMEDKSNT